MSDSTSDRGPDPIARPASETEASPKVDAPSASAAAQPGGGEVAAKPAKKKVKKPGRWKRRIKITVVLLVILFCVFRIAISIALPSALRKVAGYYNLDCKYDRASLSFMGGNVSIWHLRLLPKEGGAPLLSTDYIQGAIDPIKLLTGKLYVWRAEADGADIVIDRDAGGRIPALDRILAARAQSASTSAPPAAAASKTPPQPIDLEPPFKLDGLRVEHLVAHIRDLSVTPPLDTSIQLGVRISDAGSISRPMRFEVTLASDELLDSMRITGERRGGASNLDADMTILVRGLKLKPALGYLRPLGIVPIANNLTVEMKATLKAAASTQPATAPSLSGTLALHDISASADGAEAVGVDSINIPFPRLDSASIKLGLIAIDGVRIRGERRENGNMRFAGLDFVSASAAAPSTAPTAAARPAPAESSPQAAGSTAHAAPQAAPATAAFQWAAAGLKIRDVKIALDDHSVSPPAALSVIVDELAATQSSHDPAHPGADLDITGAIHLPGLIRDVRLRGKLAPFTAQKTLEMSIKASGIRLDLLKPYLDAAGVESLFQDGSLECTATAQLSGGGDGPADINAHLSGLKLSDRGALLSLNDLNLTGLSIDPVENLVRIKSLEIDGPESTFTREQGGAWSAVGFRVRARTGAKAAAPVPAAVVTRSPSGPAGSGPAVAAGIASTRSSVVADLPRIQIDKLAWKNIRLNLEDQTLSVPKRVALDAGLELSEFRFDLNEAHSAQPGKLRLWLSSPNIARSFTVEGTISPQPHAAGIDLQIAAQGLRAQPLAPYLASLGIDPTLVDGSITAHVRGKISRTDSGIMGSLDVEKLGFTDGAEVLASMDALHIRDAAMSGDDLNVGAIEIEKPRFRIARNADHSFEAGGVRFMPSPAPVAGQAVGAPVPAPTPAAIASTSPSGSSTGPVAAAMPVAAAPIAPAPAKGPVAGLKSLQIHDARIDWVDRSVSAEVRASAIATVQMNDLTLGRPASPAHLDVLLSIPGSIDRMHVRGTVSPAPDAQSAKLEIDAAGIRAGAMAPYLPPGTKLNAADGRLRFSIDAAIAKNPQGGQSAKLMIDNFSWRDGDREPMLAFDRFTFNGPRLDMDGKRIAIDEISLAGLDTQLSLLPGGAASALGLMIGPSPAAESPTTQAAASPAPAQAAATTSPAPQAAPISAAQLVTAARQIPPLITVEKIDLNVRRLRVHDQTRPGSTPLTLSDLRLRNVDPIKWLGHDGGSRPSTKFTLNARIDPVVDQLKVDFAVAPFALQPNGQVDISLSGIHGDGLTKLMPELRSQIDGQSMNDGRFQAHMEATLTPAHRAGGVLDLSQGFDLDFALKGVELRSLPDGPILLGLDEMRTEAARFRPDSVQIKSLELTNPVGSALLDRDGLHVAGILIKIPGLAANEPTTAPATQAAALASTEPSAEPVGEPATRAAGSPSVAEGGAGPASSAAKNDESTTAPAAVAVKPANEFRIDRLLVSGLNMRLEDRTVEPAAIIPLTGLDVDIRGLSNWLPFENKSLRFAVLINSGKVPLVKKPKGAGIPGAIGDLASLMSGKKTAEKPVLEDRDLFSEIAASGNVRLYPKLTGYAKASINAMELTEFAGEAARVGVKIGGGTFDGSVTLRFPGDGTIDVRSRLVTTDLRLSEPKNGPIVRYLGLPAPIDAAIKAIETPDGGITIPMHVTIAANSQISGIGPAVAGAIADILTKAVLSAPVKALQGAAGLIGINLKFGKHPPPPPAIITFPAGYAGLEPAAAARLAAVADELRRNKDLVLTLRHDLGGGDITVLQGRANPSSDEAVAFAYRLHAHEQELLNLRADIAGETRARLAAGSDGQAAAAVQRLRGVERELAQTEDSLDRVYDLLRPGAGLQSARRTRQASLDIGRQRLLTIQTILQSAGIPDIDQRIRLSNPQFNPSDNDAGGTVTVSYAMRNK